MTKRDYYEILGITRSADEAAIKSAYRKLALKYHPDRNPGDKTAEERFKEAAEAYAILADPGKRQRYDQFGHAGVSSASGRPDVDPTIFEGFNDLFGGMGDLFGFGDVFGGRRRGGPAQGADVRYDVSLTFEEAATGVEPILQLPRLEECDRCRGSKAEPGTSPETCNECSGRGQVRYQQGFLTVARTCGRCRGHGQIVWSPCTACRGQGRVERARKLKVKIPAGIATGQRMRLQGEGEHGAGGGPPGDLYVIVSVEDHEFFRRDGDDLRCRLPVAYPVLVLGGTIEVPTLGDRTVSINVPKGTQCDAEIRVAGQGMPKLSGRGKGDLYVAVYPTVPTTLSGEQQDLIEQLEKTMPPEAPSPERRQASDERPFFNRVRDMFG